MTRIKIKDLPKNRIISKKEMKIVLGGNLIAPEDISIPYPNIGLISSTLSKPIKVTGTKIDLKTTINSITGDESGTQA